MSSQKSKGGANKSARKSTKTEGKDRDDQGIKPKVMGKDRDDQGIKPKVMGKDRDDQGIKSKIIPKAIPSAMVENLGDRKLEPKRLSWDLSVVVGQVNPKGRQAFRVSTLVLEGSTPHIRCSLDVVRDRCPVKVQDSMSLFLGLDDGGTTSGGYHMRGVYSHAVHDKSHSHHFFSFGGSLLFELEDLGSSFPPDTFIPNARYELVLSRRL